MRQIKPIFIAILVPVILFTVFVVSCEKGGSDLHLTEKQIRYKFTLADAKTYFQTEASDVQLPLQGIVTPKSEAIDLNDITTIDWDRAECKDFSGYLSYEIPLYNSRYGHAVMYEMSGANTLALERADVHYSLLIQRGKSRDTTRMLVSTVINMVKERKGVVKCGSYKFHGRRSGFTGYVIVSNLEGRILSIYSYSKGKRERHRSYIVRDKEEANASQVTAFSLYGVSGGTLVNYGYSEYGQCGMCGKEEVLYFPDWWCMRCMDFWLPGIIVTPGEDVRCEKCGEKPCICKELDCQCGGGCSCNCSEGCTHCQDGDNPFRCPYCGMDDCDGNCNDRPGGGGDPEQPQEPGGTQDTLIVSDVLSVVSYDNQAGKEMIDPIIYLLAQGARTSKIINYYMGTGLSLEFKKNRAMTPMYLLHARTGGGKIQSCMIEYNIAGAEPAPILHELTHIWFGVEYPHIPLSKSMNSEIISLMSECLIDEDFTGEGYGYALGISDGDKDFLEEFIKKPNKEGIDRVAEMVRKRYYEIYKDFVLDRSTIMEQIENFRRMINE